MKKVFAFILVNLLTFFLVACGGNPAEDDITKVGISMPAESHSRWSKDGASLKDSFETAGFEVDLQYAGDNEKELQILQIENMIKNGCDVLIIAAVEANSLTEVLAPAAEAGIAVFAYDRFIIGTDAVTYYVSFDEVQIYREQTLYIEKALGLENAESSFNIEIFTGDSGDLGMSYFYQSAMEIMQPYIDAGIIVVQSGQMSSVQTATANWNMEYAKARMDDLISSVGYSPAGGVKLDAVLCSSDAIAQGCIEALTAAGWDAANIPVITGRDCEEANVNYILQGLQAMSVYKETRKLSDQTVKMVIQYLSGEEVDVNDTKAFHNGIKIVDTFLCKPTVCTKDNVEEVAGYIV